MLTPLLRQFVSTSSKKDIQVLIILLFVMCSILPILQYHNIALKGWMIIPNNPYILLCLLGYYLVFLETGQLKKIYLLITLSICILIVIIMLFYGINCIQYYDPILIIFACAVFLVFKHYNIKWIVADKLAPYCFGVYLTHTFFLNSLAKVFHFNPSNYMNAWLSVPLLSLCVFFAALGMSYMLSKVTFLKKYVL